MGNVADQLDKEMDTKQQQQAAIDKAKQEGKDPPEFPPSNQKDLETKLATLQFDVQRLQQLSQQFFTAATNTSKSRHDANMAIVGNYK
jgi:multidrug resistance efflux pump